MANIWQSVIFSIKINKRAFFGTTATAARFESSLQAEGMASYLKALRLEEVADCVVGMMLFVCKFGVGPDLEIFVSLNIRPVSVSP